MDKKISFIGLGKMGSAIVAKFLEAGLSLTVYSRKKERIESLKDLGAIPADSLESVVSDVDIVFTNVTDDEALISVTDVILQNMKKGAIHVSTSTILPKTAKQLEKQHLAAGCHYIAAPILGAPKMVRDTLAVTVCSGDQNAIETLMPLLKTYSRDVKNLGNKVFHANVLKICVNYSLTTALELISELYVFAEKSGLDTEVVKDALKNIYKSPAVLFYIDKIHDRTFDEVNFDIFGANKDVHLFQLAFLEVGVVPDLANVTRGKLMQAIANDSGHKDCGAIIEIIRQRAGLKNES